MRSVAVLLLASLAFGQDARGFRITVVDAATGRGVPLVELTTTGGVRYVTDSNGIIAFFEPGLMGRSVFFHVKSHGYEFPADGFKNRGTRLTPVAGKSVELRITRRNLAERLYRITGGGIYRDSVLVGAPVPIRQPVLNGGVLGQDSVVVARYRGRIRWFWGDTNRAAYPLGNFAASGATSALDSDPDTGYDLTYFVAKDGFSRPMCAVKGPGPKWLDGLMVLRDRDGRERLVASYQRVKTLGVLYERGLVIYDDDRDVFEPLKRIDLDEPLYPRGHPIAVEHRGRSYYYFGSPFPSVRVPADLDKAVDPDAYEAYDGGWRKGVPPARRDVLLRDVDSGEAIRAHNGSVFWNAYRERWIAIFSEVGGRSYLGEVWYAEADTILGPWVYARKIVTHDCYSFYNPVQHPFFDRDGGRVVYFEGTYTKTFSRAPVRTPRYDYNQIMYRLDLSKVDLPVAVYRLNDGSLARKEELASWDQVDAVAHFAHTATATDRTWKSPITKLVLEPETTQRSTSD